jgi:hypothetical protein
MMACLQVMLKMKSRHVAGTITKKKKSKWQTSMLVKTVYYPLHGIEVDPSVTVQVW